MPSWWAESGLYLQALIQGTRAPACHPRRPCVTAGAPGSGSCHQTACPRPTGSRARIAAADSVRHRARTWRLLYATGPPPHGPAQRKSASLAALLELGLDPPDLPSRIAARRPPVVRGGLTRGNRRTDWSLRRGFADAARHDRLSGKPGRTLGRPSFQAKRGHRSYRSARTASRQTPSDLVPPPAPAPLLEGPGSAADRPFRRGPRAAE